MQIHEIANLNTTLEIDPDEARILAAACRIASLHVEDLNPMVDPLHGFADPGVFEMLFEGYGAMFDAVSMAGAVHFSLRKDDAPLLSFSALRKHGTGARVSLRKDKDGEGGNAV